MTCSCSQFIGTSHQVGTVRGILPLHLVKQCALGQTMWSVANHSLDDGHDMIHSMSIIYPCTEWNELGWLLHHIGSPLR